MSTLLVGHRVSRTTAIMSTSPNYQRVAQREGGVSPSMSTDSLDANVTRSRSERFMDKLIAGKWSGINALQNQKKMVPSCGKLNNLTNLYTFAIVFVLPINSLFYGLVSCNAFSTLETKL